MHRDVVNTALIGERPESVDVLHGADERRRLQEEPVPDSRRE